MNYPQHLINFALDTIFPIKCLVCGAFSGFGKKEYVCRKCLPELKIRKGFECIGCKQATNLGKTCAKCRKSNSIDQLFISLDYNDKSVVKLIKLLKFRFIADTIDPITLLIKKYVFWLGSKNCDIFSSNPIIIPIPLHPHRFNWRGFNQAELIAREFAQIFQANIQTDILTRNEKSKPQTDLENKEERMKNPKNKFSVLDENSVKNRDVILVDDICTTGATLNECASVLKKAGAKNVAGFVVARG